MKVFVDVECSYARSVMIKNRERIFPDPIRGDVIEIGIIFEGDGEESYQNYIRPISSHWSLGAQEIHGLSKEFLMDNGSEPEDVCNDLLEIFGDLKIYSDSSSFVCHAFPVKNDSRDLFDWQYFEWLFRKCQKEYCLFKHLNWMRNKTTVYRSKAKARSIGLRSQKLRDWAGLLGIEYNAHRALDDCSVLKEVYKFQEKEGWISDKNKEQFAFDFL